MVFYTCEMCNFSSKYTTNYQKHLNSNKHLKKMGTIKVCNGKKIVPKGNTKLEVKKKCPKCDKVFTHSNSYYRHVKHYCQKKIENQNIPRSNKKNKKIIIFFVILFSKKYIWS